MKRISYLTAILCLFGFAFVITGCQANGGEEVVDRYTNRNNSEEYVVLYQDGTFLLMEDGGESTGEWEIVENKITFTFTDVDIPGIGNPTSSATINGDTLRDQQGKVWVRQ